MRRKCESKGLVTGGEKEDLVDGGFQKASLGCSRCGFIRFLRGRQWQKGERRRVRSSAPWVEPGDTRPAFGDKWEQGAIPFIPKGEERTLICRPFHMHCMQKLIIHVRPGLSVVPQGLVGCSLIPCLILSVMILMTALGKNFP